MLHYVKVFQSTLGLRTVFQLFTHSLLTQDCRMLNETIVFIREQNMLIL